MANAFETEISNSLSSIKGVWYMKIPDSGMNRFVPRPFDHILVHKSDFIALECKQCSSRTSFPLSNIRAHQIVELARVESVGCKSYLLINMRATKGSPRVNRLFALTPTQVIHWYYQQNDRASIPVDWLIENSIEINRLKLDQSSYGWGLRSLLC